MPLQLPNLDDRAYADLVEEALGLIPRYAPEWTNYNPSDPGITLIELFAFLTEMLLYRLNRVTEAQVMGFLRLLSGPQWQAPPLLDEAIQQTVAKLRQPQRAVTSRDFVEMAKQAAPGVDHTRALCAAVQPGSGLCGPSWPCQHDRDAG